MERGEEEKCRKRMKGYEIEVREAKKWGSRERLKRGLLMAIRKKGKEDKVEWLEGRTEKFIGAKLKIKGESWWIGTAYMREERDKN